MVGAGLLVAGCAATVEVTGPSPTGVVATRCAALVAAAPGSVAGQGSQKVSPSNRYVAAWGDPAVVLRCGVARPAALRPTSPCYVVNGVGWLVTQDGAPVDASEPLTGTLEFTTIGRSAYVDVTVPGSYRPAADALVDLAPTIKQHTTALSSCH